MYKFTWPVSYLPWSQSWRRDPESVPVQPQSHNPESKPAQQSNSKNPTATVVDKNGKRKSKKDKKGSTGAERGMVRLFINVGRKQRVQAKDIVGAIAGEAGISGKLVGTIDIYDKYTFVEVPKANAKKVLEKLKNVKIKGNKINIEKANKKNK